MKRRQYTIRGVSERLDNAARERAVKYRKSLNTILLETLEKGLGVSGEGAVYDDMDDLTGTWVEDEAFDEAVAAFESIDEDLWK